MKEEFVNRLWRVFVYSMIFLILIGGGIVTYPNYCRRERLMQENADLQAKIAAKRAEIAQLEEYQERFKCDADFVESIARQNRRVYPGELIFLFED